MQDREPTPPADPAVEPGDGAPARPVVGGDVAAHAEVHADPRDDHGDADDEALVRPFVITGGRTRHATVHLRVETLVVATGLEPRGAIQFEHAAILDACRQPVSVAEVAARIGVPLGVAQILVGDLADAGLVRVHAATPNATPTLLMRMIDAVRAL